MTGTGELVGLTIDPEVADPEDTETLADLVLAAVRDANNAARQLAAEQMGDADPDLHHTATESDHGGRERARSTVFGRAGSRGGGSTALRALPTLLSA